MLWANTKAGVCTQNDTQWPVFVKLRNFFSNEYVDKDITVQRALPWPPNKLSHLTTTCKYVNSTTYATVFNLQLWELCKEA